MSAFHDPDAGLLDALRQWFRRVGAMAVAWSGGADSTLLTAVGGQELGDQLLALHVHTPLHTKEERRHVEEMAAGLGVRLEVVEADPFAWPEFVANPVDRCYHCKCRLYARLFAVARRHGLTVVADGTNQDDLGDDRPGLQALRELGVETPLADLGWCKAAVRRVSRGLALPTWDRPSNSCLATRVPNGIPIDPVLIERIRQAEDILSAHGWRGSRVRLAGERAMIEVPAEAVERLWGALRAGGLADSLARIGIQRCYVDFAGRAA